MSNSNYAFKLYRDREKRLQTTLSKSLMLDRQPLLVNLFYTIQWHYIRIMIGAFTIKNKFLKESFVFKHMKLYFMSTKMFLTVQNFISHKLLIKTDNRPTTIVYHSNLHLSYTFQYYLF